MHCETVLHILKINIEPAVCFLSRAGGSAQRVVEDALHEATSGREANPDGKSIPFGASVTDPNQYRTQFCFSGSFSTYSNVVVSCSTTESHMTGRALTESRTRVNSCYLRELTLGKFIITYKHITQFDIIGQGIIT